MYFPFYRGKQFELIMLRESSEWLNKEKVIPIIEPVRTNFTNLNSSINTFKSKSLRVGIVVNPTLGEFDEKPSIDTYFKDIMLEEKFLSTVLPVILIKNTTSLEVLKELFDTSKSEQIIIVHDEIIADKELIDLICSFEARISYHIFDKAAADSRSYKSHFSRLKRVLLEDGFISAKKNSEYPVENFFSELFKYYSEDNYVGFGDYSIVGKPYSDSGGQAFAIAIHISYLKSEDQIFVRHFISDSNDSPVNIAGKFSEALLKFVGFFNTNKDKLDFSKACLELVDLNKRLHYPGLGYLKKLSMQHHLELINSLV